MVKKYTVFPAIHEPQDSTKSITTEDGTYDFENFSAYESNIILNVLNIVKKKYPPVYRSIGLANESSEIVYKPRYVLFEMLIQLYRDSLDPLDNLAVAIAYETKGAQFRTHAINHFEFAMQNMPDGFLDRFYISSPYNLFLKFSKIYEKEHEFEKALILTERAVPHSGFKENPLLDRIDLLKTKIEDPPKRRIRKASEHEIMLEEKISRAAELYINRSKFSK